VNNIERPIATISPPNISKSNINLGDFVQNQTTDHLPQGVNSVPMSFRETPQHNINNNNIRQSQFSKKYESKLTNEVRESFKYMNW
jgi:hypothetical protein